MKVKVFLIVLVVFLIAVACTPKETPAVANAKASPEETKAQPLSPEELAAAGFRIEGTTLVTYTGGETHVDIPSSITAIADYAFTANKILRSVTIPSSVTSIGEAAFAGCYSLESIDIPSSVTTIGEGAFFDSGLTSVSISNRTYVGDDAFPSDAQINYRDELAPASSGSFDGVILVQVENGNQLNMIISELRVEYFTGWDNDPPNNTFTLSGTYTNSGFTVTLPQTPDANLLRAMTGYGDRMVSDMSTRHFRFTHVMGYDSNGIHVGNFKLHDDSSVQLVDYGDFVETKGINYAVSFWYVDKDVTVNGRYEAEGYNLTLKRGWNKVYAQYFEPSGNGRFTTVAPPEWPESKVKWQFEFLIID